MAGVEGRHESGAQAGGRYIRCDGPTPQDQEIVKEHLRELGRYVVAHGFWIALLTASNVAVWVGMECAWRRWPPIDVWAVRMYLASGLLLFDNLCVLWWYAHSTKQLVGKAAEQHDTLKEQRDVMQAQLDQAKAEFKESQRQLLVSQKPLVYVERVEDPEREGYAIYRVRNAGGGAAVNVYYVRLIEELFDEPRAIGSVAAGDARDLPAKINKDLQEGHWHGGFGFLLVAEAHYTRTTQWAPTLNLRTQTAGRHGGQVLYRTAQPAVPSPSGQHQSLRDYVTNNRERFAELLRHFAEEETE